MCTNAVWFSILMVSTMPRAVSGLTKHDAPCAAVVPSFITKQLAAGTHRYCEYIAPPATPIVLPTMSSAPAPAAITTPAPSFPAGSGLSTLAAIAGIIASGTSMLTTASSPDPAVVIVETSAGPNNKPRSEGLIGVASTLISTSPSLGCGIGTDTIESSNFPALVIFVRNSFDFSSLNILSSNL